MDEGGPKSIKRNNLDQLGPKTLRAQGVILRDTIIQNSLIIFLVHNDVQSTEEEKNKVSMIKK